MPAEGKPSKQSCGELSSVCSRAGAASQEPNVELRIQVLNSKVISSKDVACCCQLIARVQVKDLSQLQACSGSRNSPSHGPPIKHFWTSAEVQSGDIDQTWSLALVCFGP